MMSVAGSVFRGRIGLIGDEKRRIDGSLHHQDRLTYDIDIDYVFL